MGLQICSIELRSLVDRRAVEDIIVLDDGFQPLRQVAQCPNVGPDWLNDGRVHLQHQVMFGGVPECEERLVELFEQRLRLLLRLEHFLHQR